MSNISNGSNAIVELPSPSSKKGLKGPESDGYLEGEIVIEKAIPLQDVPREAEAMPTVN